MPTFTIMGSGIGYMGGNYKNDQPGQAAKKAAKALFKKLKERKYAKYKNKTSIKFVLRMRDRSGPGKTYAYLATQIKLKKPLVVKRGDVEYTVQYDYKIEPCNLAEKELKSMTLGQLTVVGGKMIYTGKKLLKGGSNENEPEPEPGTRTETETGTGTETETGTGTETVTDPEIKTELQSESDESSEYSESMKDNSNFIAYKVDRNELYGETATKPITGGAKKRLKKVKKK